MYMYSKQKSRDYVERASKANQQIDFSLEFCQKENRTGRNLTKGPGKLHEDQTIIYFNFYIMSS